MIAKGGESSGAASGSTESDAASDGPISVEPRWPIALALTSFIVVTVVLRAAEPERESLGPHWLVPGIEIALLVALIAAASAHLARRATWLRPVAITLIGLLAVMAMVASAVLISELVRGSKVTVGNVVARVGRAHLARQHAGLRPSLLELDSGGPLARYRREREHPDFAFSQQLSPELDPPGWRPQYVDYLILGITTSTAFSPTDVMPMTAWAKLMTALQSLISLTVIGLVVARAVNAFT
jgi:hypothetical protein